MCSIGGFIANVPLDGPTARKLCTALLWYGTERGAQSSGCYANGQVTKRATSPMLFIDDPEFIQMFDAPVSVALTHTRMPTSGGMGDAQAQPFVHGGSVVAHNGWITNTSELKRKFNITKPSGVDSELIATYLACKGIDRFAEFLEETDGVSAIAAIHNEKLYLIRSGNPTFYCRLPLGGHDSVTVFGSTADMIEKAMAHSWLMPNRFIIQGTQQHVLLEVTSAKMKQVSRKIKPLLYDLEPYGGKYDAHDSYDSNLWLDQFRQSR